MYRFAKLLLVMSMLVGCGSAQVDLSPPLSGDPQAMAALDVGGRQEARLEEDRLIMSDGVALPLRHWLPAGSPSAVILALHGFNDYSNAFTAPGAALAQYGIATYAFDQRGFGRAPERGRWAGTATLAEDAITAATLLRRRYPEIPLYLMGESMGGAVAIVAATSGRRSLDVDGVILVAPAVWGRQTMNIFERIGLWLIDLLPATEWSPQALPVTVHPSDNIPMLRAFSTDPWVIRNTRTDALSGLVDLMSTALAAGERLDGRTLLLYGERDDIVPRPPMARFVEELPARARPRQRLAFYAQGYHMLLRDLEAPLLIADVAAWIAAPTAPLPSGADRDARARLTGRAEALAGIP